MLATTASSAWHRRWVCPRPRNPKTSCEDFLTALTRLQEACGVADLKMSDYGITPDEFETLMRNTREVMGVMFTSDRVQMSDEDIVNVYRESYK